MIKVKRENNIVRDKEMYYLADFAYKENNKEYFDLLKKDTNLRQRIVKKNNLNIPFYFTDSEPDYIKKQIENAKYLSPKKSKKIQKLADIFKGSFENRYSETTPFLQRINNTLIANYKEDLENRFKNIKPSKEVLEQTEKEFREQKQREAAEELKKKKSYENMFSDPKPKVKTKNKGRGLGKKIALGVLGTALLAAVVHDITRPRKPRSDKGKIRGKYRK